MGSSPSVGAHGLPHHPEAAASGSPPRVRHQVSGDDPQQGRLACAVGPDQRDLGALARPGTTRRPAAPCRPAARTAPLPRPRVPRRKIVRHLPGRDTRFCRGPGPDGLRCGSDRRHLAAPPAAAVLAAPDRRVRRADRPRPRPRRQPLPARVTPGTSSGRRVHQARPLPRGREDDRAPAQGGRRPGRGLVPGHEEGGRRARRSPSYDMVDWLPAFIKSLLPAGTKVTYPSGGVRGVTSRTAGSRSSSSATASPASATSRSS